MEIQEGKPSSHAGRYLLAGLIAGAAAGLLFAPQSGEQTREDIEAFRRRAAARARKLIARVSDALPARANSADVEAAPRAAGTARDGRRQFSEA
jgi:gas vesicle protein